MEFEAVEDEMGLKAVNVITV
ncbi:hypothetical protein MYX64_08100 [Nitrospinae bacterium AH_259_B05_G02_I21]|nr:hypothetical protein [Nitrospinae bacterium AH_259_B05_G02_I21]